MSLRTQFTLQAFNETTGQAIAGAQVLIVNRATNNIVIPFADEFSNNTLVNLTTQGNGIAQGWLPLAGYTATLSSPYLPGPLVVSWDSVPSTAGVNNITVSGVATAGYVLTALSPTTAAWLTVSGGGTATGTAGGDLSGSYPNPTVAHVLSGKTPLVSVNNLSDVANAGTSRTNLGLGTAATQSSAAFDAAGTSATETARAEAAEALLAPLASPALTGIPTSPTAVSGTNTTQIATTAFVHQAFTTISGAVASVFGRQGVVSAQSGDYAVAQVTGAAPLANPTFTGTPAAPTATPLTNTTQLATTGYTDAAVQVEKNRAFTVEVGKASNVNPTISGIVTASGYAATGLTGSAAAASRWVGATATGAPGSGAHNAGDFIIVQNGAVGICTAGGTPGTWTLISGGGSGGGSSTLNTRTFSGTTDTLVIGDANNVVESTGNSAVTETIPAHASVAFPVGTIVEICQIGTGKVTLAGGGTGTTASVRQTVGLDAIGTTVSPAWSIATNAGSLLIAAISYFNGGAITPPAGKGWVSLGTSSSSGFLWAIYASANASSQSGAQTWTFGSSDFAAVMMSECINTNTVATAGATSSQLLTPTATNTMTIPSYGPVGTAVMAFMAGATNGLSAIAGFTSAPGWTFGAGTGTGNANVAFLSSQSAANGTTLPSESVVLNATGTMTQCDLLEFSVVSTATGGGSVTLLSPITGGNSIAGQYGTIGIRQRATDVWVLSGDLST